MASGPEVLSAVNLVVSGPEVVSAVAASGPEVLSAVGLVVSGPEVVSAVNLVVSGPEVVSAVAASGPEVLSAVGLVVSGPEVVSAVAASGPEVLSAVGLVVSGPEVVSAVAASIVHVSERQVFVNIHIVFVVSIPVFVVVEGVDIFRRSIFFLFPNSDYSANLSSFVEGVDEESVDSPTDAHANYDLCRILSNESLYHNKNMGYIYNKPNPDHNNVSDTTDLPTDATTNHPRKRCLPPRQGQRRHTYPVSL